MQAMAGPQGKPPSESRRPPEPLRPIPAAQAGIQAGDIIQEVNRQPVQSAADVRSALAKSSGRPPLLLINRGGETVFVPVPG